jgi:hypothetical protein
MASFQKKADPFAFIVKTSAYGLCSLGFINGETITGWKSAANRQALFRL